MSTVEDGIGRRRTIVGVDPGRSKCGFAVVYEDGSRKSIAVVPTGEIGDRIESEVRSSDVTAICIGHATASDAIVKLCAARWPSIPLRVIDETNTTLEARRLYYLDHPPRGIWRFIPRGLLVPDEPLDAYAALLIVARFEAGKEARDTPPPRAGKA